MLAEQFGVAADVWSATSYTELRRDALEVERWNLLHPTESPRMSYLQTVLAKEEGVSEIRADHLIRAIAESELSDLQGTLRKLGPTPETVAAELTVPDGIRQLGRAVQRARTEHAAAFAAGGPEAVRAVEELNRVSREYSEAVTRWLGGGQAR